MPGLPGNPLAAHGDGPLNKVVRPEEMAWEDSPQGRLKHVINEQMAEGMDIPVKGTNIYIQEIPPGSRSGPLMMVTGMDGCREANR